MTFNQAIEVMESQYRFYNRHVTYCRKDNPYAKIKLELSLSLTGVKKFYLVIPNKLTTDDVSATDWERKK